MCDQRRSHSSVFIQVSGGTHMSYGEIKTIMNAIIDAKALEIIAFLNGRPKIAEM